MEEVILQIREQIEMLKEQLPLLDIDAAILMRERISYLDEYLEEMIEEEKLQKIVVYVNQLVKNIEIKREQNKLKLKTAEEIIAEEAEQAQVKENYLSKRSRFYRHGHRGRRSKYFHPGLGFEYIDFINMYYHKRKKRGLKRGQKDNPLDQILDVHEYVENFFGPQSNPEKLHEISEKAGDGHSLNVYQGQNCAGSLERSVMAHNLLKAIDVNSFLIVDNDHTYNAVQTDDNLIIFDVTNKTELSKSNDLEAKSKFIPTVQVLPLNEANDFIYGKRRIIPDDTFSKRHFKEYDKVKMPRHKNNREFSYKGLGLERGLNKGLGQLRETHTLRRPKY